MTAIDPKLRKALTGISGILVTPFDAQDKIAPARLKPIVDRAIAAGVHILVANGNTGEFYGLTTAEAETMVHAAAELLAGRAPLLAGVGRSIIDACALARASRAAGASALMVHQPPDPFVSPRGVVAYVQRIAEAGDGLPARQPRHRLGRRARGGLGTAAVRGRCAGVHLGTDQCVARAFDRHSRGAGGGRLRARQPSDRRHGAVRGDSRRGTERHQRDGREGGAPDDG